MSDQNQKFHYSYSASQQEEIDQIRNKYLPDSEANQVDKMTQLRRLDASVTRNAAIPALTVGIIGALIMGSGMSLIMTDLGRYLGMTDPMFPGMLIGAIGILGIITAYPLYTHRARKLRQRIAPQVLRLTEELSQR